MDKPRKATWELIYNLMLKQMRYSKGSKEYIDIQLEINKLEKELKDGIRKI